MQGKTLAELRGIHGGAALSAEQMNRAKAFNARMDALVEAYGGETYAAMDKGPFKAVFRQEPVPPLADSERITTESGLTFQEVIDSKDRSNYELFVNADGSTALTRIDNSGLTPTAEAGNFRLPDGDFNLSAWGAHHIYNDHGKEIVIDNNFPDVETFVIDVLNNWTDIYQGSDGSFLLSYKLKNNKHNSFVYIVLHNDGNDYFVTCANIRRITRFKDEKPLFVRSASRIIALGGDQKFPGLSPIGSERRMPSANLKNGVGNSISNNSIGVNGTATSDVFNQSVMFDEDDPRTWGNYPRKAEAGDMLTVVDLDEALNNADSLSIAGNFAKCCPSCCAAPQSRADIKTAARSASRILIRQKNQRLISGSSCPLTAAHL